MTPKWMQSVWLMVMMGAVLIQGSGCTYRRVVRDGWDDLRKLNGSESSSNQGESSGSKSGQLAATKGLWAIVLAGFEGDDRRVEARRFIREVENSAHLPDLWVQDEDRYSYVYRGRYEQPSDPKAKNDLRQTRLVQLDHGQRFADARLVPLGPMAEGSDSPLDLRRHQGMYSLQIGFYDDAFGSDYRKAAEEAAEQLRKEGEEAFYYHGPHRSMVTIGLFTDDDFEMNGAQWQYGSHIRLLQNKYPHNLGNGRTLVEKSQGKRVREQSSSLVRVN